MHRKVEELGDKPWTTLGSVAVWGTEEVKTRMPSKQHNFRRA